MNVVAGARKGVERDIPDDRQCCFVHELFQRQMALSPDIPAVVDATGRLLSYRELGDRATRLARRLRQVGVRPDDRVAVWMDRSLELVAAILGILEANGAYAPIDTAYPQTRIAAVINNLEAAALVTDLEPPAIIAAANLPTIDPTAELLWPAEASSAGTVLDPDHLAYVLHTSGSTGAPKGVTMTHRGLTRLIRWQIENGPPGLATLQFAPVCFDVTLQEVFSTLCTGGTLMLASDEMRRDPDRLLDMIEQCSIQRLFLPYVALQQVARAARRRRPAPSSLRHIITAGERLIVTDAIAELFGTLRGCRFDNQYGPTETHLATCFTLSADPTTWPLTPPIGASASGAAVYVLDGNLEPVAPGEPGELYIGGECLARGYLNQPGMTAARFLPNPFSQGAVTRIYRTGDRGWINGAGSIEFEGRADDQLKVNGFRVEPAEVQLRLLEHPQVRQVAVGLRVIGPEINGLVAYVVTDGTGLTAVELAKHAGTSLPAYMVPVRFIFVAALPLTSSGKVDHRALAAIELTSQQETAAAPASLIDTIRAVWVRVLGHDEIDRKDDFFDIGGDSLLATWVVTELSQAVGREIKLSMFLQDSTLSGMARALEDLAVQPVPTHRMSAIVSLRAGPSQRILHLCHALGGELLAYRELVRSIRSPLRVLGLRWQPEHNGDAPMSLPQMAEIHCRQLRVIQPSGPYLLAGWSFGGVLAFELAQQLLAGGEQVDFLGLLDANPVLDSTTGLPASDGAHFAQLNASLAHIDARLAAADNGFNVAALLSAPPWSALLGHSVPEGVTAMHLRSNLGITRNCLWAAMNYRAAPYYGPMDLFQPADAAAPIQARLATELRALARGALQIHPVPGDHLGMLRAPCVEKLAHSLDHALRSR